MAGFKTHLTGGIMVGLTSATFTLATGIASLWQTVCLLSLGVLGGIIPDLDSDTGRPIKLLFILTSSLVVIITAISLISRNLSFAAIFGASAVAYVACLIFFSVCKRLTVHRGIMHSIPFALLIGAPVALATSAWGAKMSFIAGLTAFSGVMIHLLLDELNSIGIRVGVVPYLKSSFGTALKFRGKSMVATFLVYALMSIFTVSYLLII